MHRKMELNGIITQMEMYHREQLSDTQKLMFIEDLIDLEPSEVLKGWQLYRRGPYGRKMPYPGQLRALLAPTDDQEARDAVSRIVKALQLYGDPYGHKANEPKVQKAKDFIGGLGWALVERMGGWTKLSQEGELDTMELAQWRELAVSLITKFRLGKLDEAPSLGAPAAKKAVGMDNMSNFTKSLIHNMKIAE